jgi:hypothetical protein
MMGNCRARFTKYIIHITFSVPHFRSAFGHQAILYREKGITSLGRKKNKTSVKEESMRATHSSWQAITIMVSIFLMGLLLASPGRAEKKAMSGATMSRYLIISPHTAEECLTALDAVSAQGEEKLNSWDWGCKAGDHTGYTVVQAESQEAALKSVPESLRKKARAIKLNKFTMDEIKSFHASR